MVPAAAGHGPSSVSLRRSPCAPRGAPGGPRAATRLHAVLDLSCLCETSLRTFLRRLAWSLKDSLLLQSC